MKQIKRVRDFLISLVFPILLLCIWQYLAVRGIVKETIMPRPTTIGATLWKLVLNGKLIRDIGISLRRVILGYLTGGIVGIVLGIGLGLFPKLNKVLNLLMEILRPIPIIAWVPVLILWVGIDEKSKIICIAIGTFWPVLLNVVSGIRNVDKKYLEVSSIFMKSKGETILKVVLPAATPSIFTGLRIASGNALMGVIGAEMFAASSGLGYMIAYAREMSQPAKMLGGVLVIGILGCILNTLVAGIEKRRA